MADFPLQIVTLQSLVFDEPVTALTLPGEDGSLGILAHHAPIVVVLKQGRMTIRQGSRIREFEIGPGFAEMSGNSASVLVDSLKEQG